MLTVESVKCRVCGARHAADAAACPICGTKARRPASADKAPQGKAKPYGLDSEALLAKIDSLDWEDPTIQAQAAPAAAAAEPPPSKRSLLVPFLFGFAVLLVGMIGLRYFSTGRGTPAAPVAVAEAPKASAAPVATTAPPAAAAAPAEAAPSAPTLTAAEAAEKAKLDEERRRRTEMKRKALAAKQALEEHSRQERAEQERLRAEREAAEARAKAAAAAAAVPPAPKAPASPQEVCAGEAGVFAQNACETRICSQAQWRNHPFCIRRWQDELRKLSPSGGG